FWGDLERPEVCSVLYVSSSTKFHTFTKTNSPYIVSVFLTEKCHRSFFNSLLKRNRTFFDKRQLLLNSLVYKIFHLFQLFVCYFGKMRKVKTKVIWSHQRTFLLYVCS